jgi:hypothetical protein
MLARILTSLSLTGCQLELSFLEHDEDVWQLALS